MKRKCLALHATGVGCAFAGVVLAGVLFTSAPVRADIDVQINIGNAPPPPHMVFRARPHERFYSRERVYVVDDPGIGDYDCFRYGGYYWMFRDGYWYRSASWRSRFVVIQPRYVPAVFYQMPATRWKHHPSGPPGLMKKGGGGPPGHVMNAGNASGQMRRNDGGHPAMMKQGAGGGPPGLAKKGGAPQGPAKKGGKGQDQQGDRGRK